MKTIIAHTFLTLHQEPTKLTMECLKFIVLIVMLSFMMFFPTAHVITSRSGGGKLLGAHDRTVDCRISIALQFVQVAV